MRHRSFLQVAALALATAWLGSTAHAQSDDVFVQPYFTERPVIEALGSADVEYAPNRAFFTVVYRDIRREQDDAAARAADAARRGVAAIRAVVGADARIAADLTLQPLYEQYRDREGERREDRRVDQIERYAANVTLSVEVLNLGLASRARAAALAAGPESVSPLNYRLEPTAEMRRDVFEAAVEDAAARARIIARATGAGLGRLLVVQEGQGPCLGFWRDGPGYGPPPPPPPPPPPMMAPSAVLVAEDGAAGPITQADVTRFDLPSEPATVTVSARVCAVYAAGG